MLHDCQGGRTSNDLTHSRWKQLTGGLLLTSLLVIAMTLLFDLSGIAMMGSAAFLLVYSIVNAGHLRVLNQTSASAVVVWLSLLSSLGVFATLAVYTYQQQPRRCWPWHSSPDYPLQANGCIDATAVGGFISGFLRQIKIRAD